MTWKMLDVGELATGSFWILVGEMQQPIQVLPAEDLLGFRIRLYGCEKVVCQEMSGKQHGDVRVL